MRRLKKLSKLVRDKSLMAMRMSGNYAEKFDGLSAAKYPEKLRLLYFSRKCCDN
jgi:hypothetical protein